MPNPILEALRRQYLPRNVAVLLVGESPPAGGTFFYRGDSNLARCTFEALWGRRPTPEDMPFFLNDFRDGGFYLVDLCLDPVNHLPHRNRRDACRAGVSGLARTITELQPLVVVCLMKGIEGYVKRAVANASLVRPVSFHSLLYPTHGHQRKYIKELEALLRMRGKGDKRVSG